MPELFFKEITDQNREHSPNCLSCNLEIKDVHYQFVADHFH